MYHVPHSFQPDFPLSNDATFLFQRIEERVAGARVLREEDGCYVVAVTYEPSPYRAIVIRGDILFWVDTKTFLVMKQQGELGHRFPTDDEVRWNRLTTFVRTIRVNENPPEDTFRFTPPADAAQVSPGGCGMSGGGGFMQHGPDERRRLEFSGSHEWQGDTLVEHSKWKIRGMTLVFERRLTFSVDETELHITERIKGPQGDTEGSFKLPVK
jgi:hypothetical protein